VKNLRTRLARRALPAVAIGLTLVVVAGATVARAASQGPADGSFYDVPTPLPGGGHGTLVSYRPATVQLGAGAPAVKAWTIKYKSTDSNGRENVVTGTALVPTAAWSTGLLGLGGTRPVVAYAPGTQGLARRCAPSNQLVAGTEYETANIRAALAKNWAVVVTDYAGYTNGSTPTYLAGRSEGNAVLDSVLSTFQVPSIGLSSSTKVGIWGYSQGGQAAAWAGQVQPSYAPALQLSGVAAGGVPGNFRASAATLNKSSGSSFLLQGVLGLATEYPTQIPLATLANAKGQAAIADAKTKCVFQTLFDYMNVDIKDYTVGAQTLDQLLAIPSVGAAVDAQNLGGSKIAVPLYQYHGRADEFLPLGQAITTKKQWCANGTNVKFDLFPSEHIATQFQAAPNVLAWMNDRFGGMPQLINNCFQPAPPPTSTANPAGGSFIVSLDKWLLGGSVYVKGLDQSIVLPSSSTFSAQTNLTTKSLTGSLSVPQFTSNLKILGVPLDVKVSLSKDPANASVNLDNAGQLHVHGTASATIGIEAAGELGINIPIGCKTSAPVQFPLHFDGPVSALGAGGLKFSGTTTFPSLTGCGLWGPTLGLLFSGPNNTYAFTVAPPAPTAY